MGPRSCERGNRRRRTRPGADVWASMGPRSCERGNAIGEQEVHQACKEASMGPRSCERGNDSGRYSGERIAQFASMGPRSCERGNCAALPREWRCAHWLQWGRARASAEMTLAIDTSSYLRTLQWGRARASAEMRRSTGSDMRAARLQWGRARASAEITRQRKSLEMIVLCFNGAALVRARKWPRRRIA